MYVFQKCSPPSPAGQHAAEVVWVWPPCPCSAPCTSPQIEPLLAVSSAPYVRLFCAHSTASAPLRPWCAWTNAEWASSAPTPADKLLPSPSAPIPTQLYIYDHVLCKHTLVQTFMVSTSGSLLSWIFRKHFTILYARRACMPLVKAWIVIVAFLAVRYSCLTFTMRYVFWMTRAARVFLSVQANLTSRQKWRHNKRTA